MRFCNYKSYISTKGEEGVKKFKYKGGSDSFLYKLIWVPISEFLIKYIIPDYIAPNLITLVSIIELFLVHCYDMYY